MKVRYFDVCVLGHGVGGLVAALTLQRKGSKVLVIHDRRSETFEPTLCEFFNGFTIKPVLKRVGFHPSEVNAIPSLPAPLQIVIGDHRIDCFGDEKRFERELLREFPDHAKQILRLFKESSGHLELYQHLFNSRTPLPPRGFFARRRFRKVLEQVCDKQLLSFRPFAAEMKTFDVGDEFGRVLEALELGLGGMISPWITGSRLAHLLTLIRWEGYFAPQGVRMLQQMLLAKLREHGAITAECQEIENAMLGRSIVKGFRIAGCEWDEVHCEVALVAGDPRGLTAMDPKERPLRQLRKHVESLRVHALKASQVYRLRPGGIPVGMQSQGILVPEERLGGEGERRRLIRAVRYVVHRVGKEGKEKEILLGLTAFLRGDAEVPPERLDGEIRQAIRQVIPFVDDYLLERPRSPYVPSREGRPGDFRQGFVYYSESQPALGISGISPETPAQNVFLAGDMVFPGLGLDGEIIAGLQAAHLTEEALPAERQKL